MKTKYHPPIRQQPGRYPGSWTDIQQPEELPQPSAVRDCIQQTGKNKQISEWNKRDKLDMRFTGNSRRGNTKRRTTFSLNANDSQQIGRRIFRRPMVFMRHRARRMERRIARAVGAGSVAGAVAGASVARAGKPATNQPPKKRENTSASMGSRVGSAVGAVMDTKNKVRDSASSLKENVKDLPTQAGYAVHSAKQKAKDNVSDFKRGVVEERENRQEQRTQKRNLHRGKYLTEKAGITESTGSKADSSCEWISDSRSYQKP